MEHFAAQSAYEYPLLIKQLLHNAVMRAGDREIVTGLEHRYSYATFQERLGRLASVFPRLVLRLVTRLPSWIGTAIVILSAFLRFR